MAIDRFSAGLVLDESVMNLSGLRKKILLIEDDESLVKALSIRLRAGGYDVFYALDVLQGVQKAHRERPGLIILDVRMPGGDGFLAAQRLKHSSITKDIPLIFLTGLPESEGKKRALELGAQFYLQKPYDPEDLLNKVETALAMGESQKASLKGAFKRKTCSQPDFIPAEPEQRKPPPAELEPCKCGLSSKRPVCDHLPGDDLCRCSGNPKEAGAEFNLDIE